LLLLQDLGTAFLPLVTSRVALIDPLLLHVALIPTPIGCGVGRILRLAEGRTAAIVEVSVTLPDDLLLDLDVLLLRLEIALEIAAVARLDSLFADLNPLLAHLGAVGLALLADLRTAFARLFVLRLPLLASCGAIGRIALGKSRGRDRCRKKKGE
jgi:hypothetical protein